MIAPTIRREPIRLPPPPPAPLDALLAELARAGTRPTRSAILAAALDAGCGPEFAATIARRAEVTP
jgi:hypothetical protein